MESLYVTLNTDQITEVFAEGEIVVYKFQHSSGTVKHTFIKREVPVRIDGEIYYDLASPLSYSGPIIIKCSEEDKWELVDEFERTFQAYCIENRIICESVSFDPLLLNAVDFACCYEVECVGDTNDNKICTGKKAWQSEIYRKACTTAEVGFDGDFFPAYSIKENKIAQEKDINLA